MRGVGGLVLVFYPNTSRVSYQCIARMWSARRKLKKLRQEARELGNIKQQNAELKQQNGELKARVGELEVEVEQLKARVQRATDASSKSSSVVEQSPVLGPTHPKSEREEPSDSSSLRASELDEVCVAAVDVIVQCFVWNGFRGVRFGVALLRDDNTVGAHSFSVPPCIYHSLCPFLSKLHWLVTFYYRCFGRGIASLLSLQLKAELQNERRKVRKLTETIDAMKSSVYGGVTVSHAPPHPPVHPPAHPAHSQQPAHAEPVAAAPTATHSLDGSAPDAAAQGVSLRRWY